MPLYLCGLSGNGLRFWGPNPDLKNEDFIYMQDIRIQFAEQLKLLEGRTETQVSILAELGEFYKRRAEIELDYSRNLEKLAKQTSAKHKTEKQKREAWGQHSVFTLWQDLVEGTRGEAKDRSCMADLYSNHVTAKLNNHQDDIQRIARKCRDIGAVSHQEISRVLNELHTAMKTYQICHGESAVAETKFKALDQQKVKFEETHPQKVGNSRKYRYLEKEHEKKYLKYQDLKQKALRARNEYLLCVDAANAALHKYFADDLSDLIDCMDLGLQQWLAALLATVLAGRKSVVEGELDSLARVRDFAEQMDPRVDKQKFIESNHGTFMLPRRFEFRPHAGDEVRQVSAQKPVQEELIQRYMQMEKRLEDLRLESEEVWKTLETAEKRVLELQQQPVVCIADLFTNCSSSSGTLSQTSPYAAATANTGPEASSGKRPSCRESEVLQQKRRQDLAETEDFYLQKFQHYLLSENLIRRLQARHEALRVSLGVKPQPSPVGRVCVLPVEGSVMGMWKVSSIPSSPGVHNGVPPSPRSPALQETGFSYPMVNRPGRLGGECRGESRDESEGPETPSSVDSDVELSNRPPSLPPKPRKKRIGASGRANSGKRPKLFGGSLEEYVEVTAEEIPLVVRSCIRALGMHALHHQGVFRVSGSQVEINNLKEYFEKGEDPLDDTRDGIDVNSVAGTLKLYFRELREPLFPIFMFDQFTDTTSSATRTNDKKESLIILHQLLQSLPRPVFLVMRYLFAFLNHLSEFSDENMMDPYNLAICFGPTLMPIPDGKDQVVYHNHVNELMRNFIIYHEMLFPNDGGVLYSKYLIPSHEQTDDMDEPYGAMSEDKDMGDGMETSVAEELAPPSPAPSPLVRLFPDSSPLPTDHSSHPTPPEGTRPPLQHQESLSLDDCSPDFPLIDAEEESPLSDLSGHVGLRVPESPHSPPHTHPLHSEESQRTLTAEEQGEEDTHNQYSVIEEPVPHPPSTQHHPDMGLIVEHMSNELQINYMNPDLDQELEKSAQVGQPLWLKRTSLERSQERPIHITSPSVKLNLHKVAPKIREEQNKERLLGVTSVETDVRSDKRRYSERVGKETKEVEEDKLEWSTSPVFKSGVEGGGRKRFSLQADAPLPSRLTLSEYSPNHDHVSPTPTSIHAELNAVLHSLQNFSAQSSPRGGSSEVGSGPLNGSSPRGRTPEEQGRVPDSQRKTRYAPDLVRNLPLSSSSPHVSPPQAGEPMTHGGDPSPQQKNCEMSSSVTSHAERFAETTESTLRKVKENSPAGFSDENSNEHVGGNGTLGSNGTFGSRKGHKHKSPAPKPPVPRKPIAPTPPLDANLQPLCVTVEKL